MLLTIGEVARRAGVRTSALRYYEEVGVLPPPERKSGQRRYDETVLARLAVVRLAQELGFTVAEIRALGRGLMMWVCHQITGGSSPVVSCRKLTA